MSRPSVAFVTADIPISRDDVDLPLIVDALATRGIDGRGELWTDRSARWEAYDLVVMRSPWDYPERPVEFANWLAEVRQATTVRNCPDLISWNMDKHYLLELSAAGVPCVATATCTTMAEVAGAMSGFTSTQVVLKPAVSAGARRTGRFDGDDPAALALARAVIDAGDTLLVQPAVPDVARTGETALVYFDGVFSHACTKGPILADGGGLLGGDYRERLAPVTPRPEQLDVAAAALAAVTRAVVAAGCSCADPTPLYGRVDLVEDDERGPLLLEAELFEPSYFLDHAPPGAPARFAEAVAGRLSG